jgi:hypothetical protein
MHFELTQTQSVAIGMYTIIVFLMTMALGLWFEKRGGKYGILSVLLVNFAAVLWPATITGIVLVKGYKKLKAGKNETATH